MRSIPLVSAPILLVASLAGTPASAQLADQLSRGRAPNALDRAVAQPPAIDSAALARADQQRADEATRDAARDVGPVAGSTMTDGPSGLQGSGSVAATPPPTPNT